MDSVSYVGSTICWLQSIVKLLHVSNGCLWHILSLMLCLLDSVFYIRLTICWCILSWNCCMWTREPCELVCYDNYHVSAVGQRFRHLYGKKKRLVCPPFFNESTNTRLFASTEKCKGTLSKCSPGILLVVLQIARNLWRSLKSEV